MARTVEKVLVVEDNRALARSLGDALAPSFSDVRACRSVAELTALTRDWWPDLVLLDVVLPDGDARSALALLQAREPAPIVVAMSGQADRALAFELGTRGVRAFLEKPLALDRLEAVLRHAIETPPELAPSLRQCVGHVPLKTVETEVREVMIREALARTDGSRRGAARLLAMSRQLLQYLMRRQG
ncbi:MAG TPA: response regulator [Polyangia bacterium]|nr:response regulator [Polyangia bacterium]